MRTMKISALGDGWALHVEGMANLSIFMSGAAAEAAALNLAQRSARAGQGSQTTIILRTGALAARRVCEPAPMHRYVSNA